MKKDIQYIHVALQDLREMYGRRKRDTELSRHWALRVYKLSRACELAGCLSDTALLYAFGMNYEEIRLCRLFAKRLPDIQTLEGLIKWMRETDPLRKLSHSDITRELACTGKPVGSPRWEGATWQAVGHKGADGHFYYNINGPHE